MSFWRVALIATCGFTVLVFVSGGSYGRAVGSALITLALVLQGLCIHRARSKPGKVLAWAGLALMFGPAIVAWGLYWITGFHPLVVALSLPTSLVILSFITLILNREAAEAFETNLNKLVTLSWFEPAALKPEEGEDRALRASATTVLAP